jgi:hypothetical protein
MDRSHPMKIDFPHWPLLSEEEVPEKGVRLRRTTKAVERFIRFTR